MLPSKDIGCHRTGFQKTCFECVTLHCCQLWQQIIGADPNTGEQINRWGCSDVFANMLRIENAKEIRQAAASIDRFNNDMAIMNGVINVQNSILGGALAPALPKR